MFISTTHWRCTTNVSNSILPGRSFFVTTPPFTSAGHISLHGSGLLFVSSRALCSAWLPSASSISSGKSTKKRQCTSCTIWCRQVTHGQLTLSGTVRRLGPAHPLPSRNPWPTTQWGTLNMTTTLESTRMSLGNWKMANFDLIDLLKLLTINLTLIL